MKNIYSAPSSELVDKVNIELELATRWERLFASLIDGIISSVLIFLLMMVLGIWDAAKQGIEPSTMTTIGLVFASFVFYVFVHGYFLHKDGQTIGKKVLGVCIVGIDNNSVTLIDILTKRHLPILLVSLIPFIGSFLWWIDVLFIFRSDKRCIHDLIAGTKVVKLKSSPNESILNVS